MKLMKKIVALVLAGSIIFSISACTKNETTTQSSGSEITEEYNVKKELTEDIHVNQIGFKNTDKKIAVIKGEYSTFYVINTATGQVVLTKPLSGKFSDESTGETVCYADFSELSSIGAYYINVPELGNSYEFKIGDNTLYNGITTGMLKALYFQRCGNALDSKYAGEYFHAVCHKAPAKLYEDQTKELDVSGGWHDASDYGKYVVPASVTAADLMLAYEFYPQGFSDSNNIPESGNKIPDILDEAKYGIEWMLKMQDEATGGVHHSVNTRAFPDINIMPELDLDAQLVMPVSTNATADFAAVTAMAARVFEGFDDAFSAKCLTASQQAWKWLEENKDYVEFKNPKDVISGEYGDSSGSDEKLWAAAELFRTTGEERYNDYFVGNFESNGFGLGWQNVSGFAAIAYMFTESDKLNLDKSEEIRKGWLEKADMFVSTSEKDGYLLAMHKIEYNWGSNMNVANHGIHLLIADKLNNNEKYKEVATNSAHYIMGRNSLNQSYITGYGSKQVMQPYHIPSIGDTAQKPVPGFMVGGPNSALEDDLAKEKLTNTAPAKCYIDDMRSYSTNEVSTYWNSSAIFVFAYINSEK